MNDGDAQRLGGTRVRNLDGAAVDLLRPVWESLLQWFGPERLLWGSDWPVLTLASDYAAWLAVSAALIGELSPLDQARVWHANAARFYALEVA
jgi:L-fuconolactonase